MTSWNTIRNCVRRRDNYTCQYCGLSEETHDSSFHVHHVIPRSDGGTDEIENLVLLCPSCHRKLEGIDYKPEFLGGSYLLNQVTTSLTLDTLLNEVEKELKLHSNDFHVLFGRDYRVCGKCFSNRSSLPSKFPYLMSFSRNADEYLRWVLNDSEELTEILERDAYFYGEVSGKCDDCGEMWGEMEGGIGNERFDDIIENICFVLNKKNIEYEEDILKDIIHHLKVLPHNQFREERVIERSVNYVLYCERM